MKRCRLPSSKAISKAWVRLGAVLLVPKIRSRRSWQAHKRDVHPPRDKHRPMGLPCRAWRKPRTPTDEEGCRDEFREVETDLREDSGAPTRGEECEGSGGRCLRYGACRTTRAPWQEPSCEEESEVDDGQPG